MFAGTPFTPPGGKRSCTSEGPPVIAFGVDDQGAINEEKTDSTNSSIKEFCIKKDLLLPLLEK